MDLDRVFWWVLAVQGLLRADAWVDVVILGGREYDNVLVYRARVLSSNIERMIIAQQHRSFSGAAGQPQLCRRVSSRLCELIFLAVSRCCAGRLAKQACTGTASGRCGRG